MRFPQLRLSPVVRTSMGLVSLMLAGLLASDLIFGLIPSRIDVLREVRARTTDNLAVQVAVLTATKDVSLLMRTLDQATARNTSMRSVAIRKEDGQLIAQAGDHARHWIPPPPGVSTFDHVRVPLHAGERKWADLEVSFEPTEPHGLWAWLEHYELALPLLLAAGGFVFFSFYLRKVLQYLDPSAVIPERVRAAFDGFSEGVMVVDKGGRIMLANNVFRSWIEGRDERIYGRAPQELPWFRAALRRDPKEYPWTQAMETRQTTKGDHIEIKKLAGASIKAIINCAPIQDGEGKVRGCLVTFDDVSEMDHINEQLLSTLAELQTSREKIEKQNEELRRLATRDPLTGCLNRRAFFEDLDKLYVGARDGDGRLCCIMTDIDHFKSFNDRYGHALGDQVLQAVSRTLSSGLRAMDLLCRYGGEEFCIMLPGVGVEEAKGVAERLRADIESRAASSVRSTQSLKITSSFGVATLSPGLVDPAELIEMADQALYAAKDSGRNRVRTWDEVQEEKARRQPKSA